MLYTTGEIAKLCGVSVRTVQYYDTRGILVPHELSEGGRRLFSDEDLDKMKIICFLRQMGFSIDNIARLFSDETSEEVISILIEQQEKALKEALDEKEKSLEQLTEMKRALKSFDHFSVKSIGDIAHIMKNQKKRKKLLGFMLCIGILMDVIEVGTLIYGINSGNWIPLIVGIPIVIGLGIAISVYYFHHVVYICPACHEIFKPKLAASFWSSHTPNTRRLTCPNCGKKSFCVETYSDKNN